MNTTTEKCDPGEIEREIGRIKRALLALGTMHPGSVSRQYQVCGKPGCRCMDDQKPRRHGPYHKLSYVHRGRPVCRFVRAECAADLSARLETYKTFRTLTDRWVELSIRQGAADFFTTPTSAGNQGKAAKTDAKRTSR
ncbi:MAG: hypothetical protein GX608_13460 [Lentisphaerae bacterium]|nr:hypothetical protein [Lentisphaerota bacterium]